MSNENTHHTSGFKNYLPPPQQLNGQPPTPQQQPSAPAYPPAPGYPLTPLNAQAMFSAMPEDQRVSLANLTPPPPSSLTRTPEHDHAGLILHS